MSTSNRCLCWCRSLHCDNWQLNISNKGLLKVNNRHWRMMTWGVSMNIPEKVGLAKAWENFILSKLHQKLMKKLFYQLIEISTRYLFCLLKTRILTPLQKKVSVAFSLVSSSYRPRSFQVYFSYISCYDSRKNSKLVLSRSFCFPDYVTSFKVLFRYLCEHFFSVSI